MSDPNQTITHEWSVDPKMKTKAQDGHSDVVYRVKFNLMTTLQVNDDTWTALASVPLQLDTSNLTDFTAFSDLTKEQVLAWAKATIDANAANGKGVTCAEWESGQEQVVRNKYQSDRKTRVASWSSEEAN